MFDTPSNVVEAVRATVGHWTDDANQTGCTVVLFDRPPLAVVDARGGAPGTRETMLLRPGDLVQTVDALLLTGGSAFGLGAADGVMRFLRERGRGVTTPAGPVPIVPAAVIYDLAEGNPVWPTADAGYAAAEAASDLDRLARGRVGVGRGATTGKLWGYGSPGGIGVGRCGIAGGGSVSAITVVNAAGMVVSDPGSPDPRLALTDESNVALSDRTATCLSVVLVDGPCDARALHRVVIAAHDGMARRIVPCHTIFDGDVVFAVGLQVGDTPPSRVLAYSVAAELAIERSIVDAVATHE